MIELNLTTSNKEQEIDYMLYKAIQVGYMVYIPYKHDCQY